MIQKTIDYDPKPLPHNGTATSIAAADSQSTRKVQLDRERILAHVRNSGGETRDQIEEATGMIGNTIRPRVKELLRAGKLVETTIQRPTRTGRGANVLVIGEGK